MKLFQLLQTAVLIAASIAASPVRGACPDLALVLSIDASSSINKQEYALQMQGYASALASPQVHDALRAAGLVTIGIVLWGDGTQPVQILPLRLIATRAEAMALGETLVTMPRRIAGNTGLGRGLAEALHMLQTDAPCAVRRIVDVSGDGRESFSPRARDRIVVRTMRDRAAALGITVNGLAILNEHADIAAYYHQELITGPGAFVEEVAGFEGFAAAILRKMVREISPAELASLAPGD